MKRRGAAAGKDAVFALNFNREDGPHFIFARNDPPLFCTRDPQATSQQQRHSQAHGIGFN